MNNVMDPSLFLEETYKEALQLVGSSKKNDLLSAIDFDQSISVFLDVMVDASETSKGCFTVFLTSLVYKLLNPEQDIRYHQADMPPGSVGYSGRSFDSQYITPFLKSKDFPSMKESGWLTRSMEQKVPYVKSYPGAIRPRELKIAFLELIDFIEVTSNDHNRKAALLYVLASLIEKRDREHITLAKPQNLTISQITDLLVDHFSHNYQCHGASRLPVLALYALYQIFMDELVRFHSGTQLLSLESHTSADKRSGRLGDIDVVDVDNVPYEAIEVKFGIPISPDIVEDAYNKFKGTHIKRYYLLSDREEIMCDRIDESIRRIKNSHGCQIIVNGIYPTIRYYLRIISDPSVFIANYTHLLERDSDIKYAHKKHWNDLVGKI